MRTGVFRPVTLHGETKLRSRKQCAGFSSVFVHTVRDRSHLSPSHHQHDPDLCVDDTAGEEQAAHGGRLRAGARPRGAAAGPRAGGRAERRVFARVPAALCRARCVGPAFYLWSASRNVRGCLLPRTEQIVETPVLPVLEEENCVDVMHLTPQERENRTQEPIVGVPVPDHGGQGEADRGCPCATAQGGHR